MSSGADSPDSEPRISLQDVADPVHLSLQRLPLGTAKRGKRLDRDLNPPAGAALMPDPSDHAINQHDRIVARLAGWRKGSR